MKLISIIIPVYNEEKNIEPVYDTLKKLLNPLKKKYDYELIFSDNRSTDKTFSILRKIAKNDLKVKVLIQ